MGLADITSTTANIELTWENTRVAISVITEIDSKIMKTIESTIVQDTRPFYQAASYYYENNKDLKQALEWTEKAIVANPKAYWVVLLKAKIQLKLNDKKGAIATANQVIVIATADKDDSFVKQAEKLIASAK
jgi:tetratricopeptide (TPR) repeat protein